MLREIKDDQGSLQRSKRYGLRLMLSASPLAWVPKPLMFKASSGRFFKDVFMDLRLGTDGQNVDGPFFFLDGLSDNWLSGIFVLRFTV